MSLSCRGELFVEGTWVERQLPISRVILDYTCRRAKYPLLKFRRRSGLLAQNSEMNSALVNKTNVQGINSISLSDCPSKNSLGAFDTRSVIRMRCWRHSNILVIPIYSG